MVSRDLKKFFFRRKLYISLFSLVLLGFITTHVCRGTYVTKLNEGCAGSKNYLIVRNKSDNGFNRLHDESGGNRVFPHSDLRTETRAIQNTAFQLVVKKQLRPINISKEDVDYIYAKRWRRSKSADSFPIPSYDGRYEMNNERVCFDHKRLTIIILVQTATENFLRRSALRNMWASIIAHENYTVRMVFFLGKPAHEGVQFLLRQEQNRHGDLVQGTFVDTYRNLTHKSVLGLRWVSEFCPNAEFVLRMDDDVFVNVFKILELLDTGLLNKPRHIWCQVKNKYVYKIQRHGGKWKVDEEEFKNMTHYPFTHCNGPFAIITGDIISDLFQATKLIPFFWIEDVYIYGLCVDLIGNIRHKQLLHLYNFYDESQDCCRNSTLCNKIAAFFLTAREIENLMVCFHRQYYIGS